MKKSLAFALLLLLSLPTLVLAQEDEPNRAALVVSFGEGESISQCVAFTEPEISGYDLLLQSGLELETAVSFAAMICSIEETGCPADDCFCQCRGADCVYWSYWYQEQDAWQYSQAGANIHSVRDGAVEGWVWGAGQANKAPSPPDVTFADVCTAPEPTPEVVADVAATAVPIPTPTLVTETAVDSTTSSSSYIIFGLIVIGLGVGFMWTQRKNRD
jgi:hypothetical protein